MTTDPGPPIAPSQSRLPARFAAWLSELPLPVKIGIAIAIAVNAVLAGAWVWSRPGQTTYVRFTVQDNDYKVYVDGRLQQRATFKAPDRGGVWLTVEDTKGVPSVPRPSGIDSVRITDLDTGEQLYDNDFSVAPDSSTLVQELSLDASLAVADGVLKAQTESRVPGGSFAEATMRIDGTNWHNYAVDVKYRNLTTGIIRVRATADGSGVEYGLRPFRHLDNRITLFKAGTATDNRNGVPVEASTIETVKSMVAMAVRPYPVMLLLFLVGFIVVASLQFALPALPDPGRWIDRFRGWTGIAPWIFVAVLAEAVFGLLLYYIYGYGSHMPHVPDEVSYIFQAKVFAAGHLTAPPPPVADSFQLGNPPLTVVTDGKWASLYPFGHPLMLALGVRIGALWLIPPIIGSASIVLLFAIGRRLYNTRIGLLAAVLFAASPFFLMTASNFMSHNTAAFFLLLSILFLAYADKRPVLFPFLAGIFFGFVFNTRQLSGAALVPPFGLLLLTFPLAPGRRLIAGRQLAAFATGGALMLLAYLAYRYGTTGHPLASQGIQTGENSIGFGGAHSVSAGVENERTQLTYLVMMISNWPILVGLMFVFVPFALGTRNRWDWFFLIATACLMGVYTLYFTTGFMHGPRYWYETTPLLLLLTARGADVAAGALAGAAARARSLLSPTHHPPPLWAGIAVVYLFVLVLTFAGWQTWALGHGESTTWRGDFAPFKAEELRGFNGINDQLTRQIDDLHLHNALVIVGECTGWQCYGNVDWRNSPWLDGDIVYARDFPPRNADLLKAFPDRLVYYARYFPHAVIGPYDGSPIPDQVVAAPGGEPRKASSFPAPAAAVPTPENPLAVTSRDDLRKQNLAVVAIALAKYRETHGTYPVAANVQTLCTYPDDVGCSLKEILDPFPVDPDPNATFWYQSLDGSQFTLFTHLENAAPPSACPPQPPSHLANVDNLYCLSSPRPATGQYAHGRNHARSRPLASAPLSSPRPPPGRSNLTGPPPPPENVD